MGYNYEWHAEEEYESAARETYGSVDNLLALKAEIESDINYKEFCKTVIDRENIHLESIYDADCANEDFDGHTYANCYDRVAIDYKGYPFYICWFAEEDLDRAYRIYYGYHEYKLGNFTLVTHKEVRNIEPKIANTDIDEEDSPF